MIKEYNKNIVKCHNCSTLWTFSDEDVVGLITSIIAARFNEFDTTPFSKYTFSKFCYEFEGACNTLVAIGATMVVVSLFI